MKVVKMDSLIGLSQQKTSRWPEIYSLLFNVLIKIL